MLDAKDVIRKVGKEFGEMTGRTYGLIETYMMDDAEEAIVIIGSSAGTAKEAINELRAQGKKVGQIKVRSFRPFPSEDICEALKNVKAFAVMDKDDSFNAHWRPHVRGGHGPPVRGGHQRPQGHQLHLRPGRAATCGWRASSTCSRSWRRSRPPARWARPIATWTSGNKEGKQSWHIV